MRIAIAGYGVEGKASYRYFAAKYPEAEMTILDEQPIEDAPVGVEVRIGKDVYYNLAEFDIAVRTAGLSPSKLQSAQRIWSATNEFFEQCSAPIIGVTGTKGKGTTSSLIASILRAAGKTVHLVGNIGVAALDFLGDIKPDDIVVYELSSFQLWDLEKSPHISVVLPIEPDHLDVHLDYDDYISAKANIAKHQGSDDVVVYHQDNQYSRQIASLSASKDKRAYPVQHDALDALVIPGLHNRDNASAAILAVKDLVDDENIIRQGLASFTGLPHRLKFVAEVAGVRYYDDSIGTTAGSSVAAIKSFAEPKILILGGSSKGTTYSEVIGACKISGTRVLGVGQTGREIVDLARRVGVEAEYVDGDMTQVVARASQVATPGEVVILSPASASFDQYKNYADRGDQFIAAVQVLSVRV